MIKKKHKKILVLGDVHTPFHDMEVIKQAHEFNKKFKADIIINLGDLTDQKAFSRYPKDPEDDGPQTEWHKAVKGCHDIAKLFPKMTVINSNHDRRFLKKASEAGLPKEMVRSMKELIGVPGWSFHMGPDPLVIDGIAFIHGDELNGAPIVKAQKLGMNVVQGHCHQSVIQYFQTFQKKIWAMDAGCVIDKKSAAFDYAASAISKVWVGFAYIEDGIPHLVPKKGR